MFRAGTVAKGGSASGPIVSISNMFAFCSNPGFVDVGVRALRDGTIQVEDNCGGFAFDQNYLTSGLPDATIGDNYEVMMTLLGGTPPTAGSLGIWQQINVTRSWTFSEPATFDAGVWRMEIREIAVPANTDLANFDWNTEDGS